MHGMKPSLRRRSPMASRLPLCIPFLLLLLLPPLSSSHKPEPVALTYHGGPLLAGDINLSLLWYGRIGRVQKSAIRGFIRSLNSIHTNFEPPVSVWWNIVESYQSAANHKLVRPPKINVRVAKQLTDPNYSIGKVITKDFLVGLVDKATGRARNTIALIFTAREVAVEGLCMGKCSLHGIIGKQLYMIVGNPETECPGACAWPFHRSNYGPQGVTLQPPNGNVGADAMIIAFASVLAGTVTNPFDTGFFDGPVTNRIEASTACPGMFGSGYFPGYTGKIRINPSNGGCFNAHGVRGKTYLLPALWNPKTASCWTII